MAKVTLAAANVAITHDKQANLRRFLELIDEAAGHGVNVLVLPEVGLQGYADFAVARGSKEGVEQEQYFFREAETIPGPSTEVIRAAAERHGMHVQLGMAEAALDGTAIYNSTALIGPTGVLGSYRKVHNQFEFPYFSPGEATPTFDTPFGRAASLICYDLCFPELMRGFAVNGAEVVLMSTGWPMQGHNRSTDYYGWAMDLTAQANAFFNQMWLVISNHSEQGVASTEYDYYGGSQIVDPYGKVVAYLAEGEGLAVYSADLHQGILESRTSGFFGLNLLNDRRPEHYASVTDETYRDPGRPSAASEPTSGAALRAADKRDKAGSHEPVVSRRL